jgi:hypothetical protein
LGPRFLVKKPRSYYFAPELDGKHRERLEASALDADAVIRLSKEPWPGCQLPWKVRTISAAGSKRTILMRHSESGVTIEYEPKRRTRKGKKSRIALRKKMHAAKAKQEQVQEAAKNKLHAEREKRTLKNRQKKLKKKEREKAKNMTEEKQPE